MDAGLSREDEHAVRIGRQALAETIEQFAPSPERVMPLCVVAISGTFADILTASEGAIEVVAIVNAQIRQSGWQLTPVRRH